MFRVDPNLSVAGTSLVDTIDLAPAFLVQRFGQPSPCDGFKCTGCFTFIGDDGAVFTVYEYKLTAAYTDGPEDALQPEEFWQSADEQELSVGGCGRYLDGSAQTFVDWLLREYRSWRPAR